MELWFFAVHPCLTIWKIIDIISLLKMSERVGEYVFIK